MRLICLSLRAISLLLSIDLHHTNAELGLSFQEVC